MRTWEDYKNHVKAVSEEERQLLEEVAGEIENLTERCFA